MTQPAPTPIDAAPAPPAAPHLLRFASHDGAEIAYRHWPAASGRRRGSIVLLHRGHEHSGRVAHLPGELGLPDFDFFAWDARGHGLSCVMSPRVPGQSPGFATSVRDVQAFVDHLGARHGVAVEDVVVVAQSVGAVLAATWVHDYAPRIRGMSLASPAFSIKLYVPFALTGIRLMLKLRGDFFINSYVKPQWLTHDPERIASYRTDPLITRPISARVLLGLHDAADRVVADAAAIVVPTQVLVSGSDWVVREKPQRDFYRRLASPVKELIRLPDFHHDTLGERDRHLALAPIRAFVEKLFAAPQQSPDLRDADRCGATFDESARLAKPLAAWSPRGAYWAATRRGLGVGARLSAGIALGQKTGFDSGSTLDYVYRRAPQGAGPLARLGKMIDAQYLDSIGWRGIRQRKVHVEELLAEAMRRVRERGLPVRLMDVAAGHGRYVLDAVAASPVAPDSVLLRDYSELNVRAGAALIAERGLQNVARFVQADAFDRAGLAAVTPAPTVAVVSGLYELFADNAMVARSLAGIADAVPAGGCLVYTGQPWHPQLEFIARALTSHRQGQAWVMRRRTQLEMDQLVAAAGFRKVAQRIDEHGIFTVSLAERVAAAA